MCGPAPQTYTAHVHVPAIPEHTATHHAPIAGVEQHTTKAGEALLNLVAAAPQQGAPQHPILYDVHEMMQYRHGLRKQGVHGKEFWQDVRQERQKVFYNPQAAPAASAQLILL